MWGQLATTCSNVLKPPNVELLVAVNHNQLRTMASETVDPIDWSHPPPSWAVPPERLVHSINQCNISNHLAYAVTQGIEDRVKPLLKIPSVFCEFECYNRKLCVNKPISFFSYNTDPNVNKKMAHQQLK